MKERTAKVKINEKRALDLLENYVSGRIKPKDKNERELFENLFSAAIKRLTPGEEKKTSQELPDKKNLPGLLEKYKTLQKKTPTGKVSIEGNFIEYPACNYSHKHQEGNYVVYEGEGFTTKVGSPDGPFTGFNEFQLWAIMMYTQKKDGKFIAKNNLTRMLCDMGLKPHGNNLTRGFLGLEKIAKGSMTTQRFWNAEEKKYGPENIYTFFDSAYIPRKGDKKRDFIFVLSDTYAKNLEAKYCITTHWEELKELPTYSCRKLLLYLIKSMGNKKSHTEDWRKIAKKLNLKDPKPYRIKRAFTDYLKIYVRKGNFDRYEFKGKNLTVYPPLSKQEETPRKEKTEAEKIREFNSKRESRVNRLQGELMKMHIKRNKIKKITDTHYIDFLEEKLKETKARNPENPAGYFLKLLKKYGR